jgi:hypothetical protein
LLKVISEKFGREMTFAHQSTNLADDLSGEADSEEGTISDTFYKLFESYPNSKNFFAQFR